MASGGNDENAESSLMVDDMHISLESLFVVSLGPCDAGPVKVSFVQFCTNSW